jgi:hypothetical protein
MFSTGPDAVFEAAVIEQPPDPGLRLTAPGLCIIGLALLGLVNSIGMMIWPPAPPKPGTIDPKVLRSYEQGRAVAMGAASPLVALAYLFMLIGGAGMIRREIHWLGVCSALMAMVPCSPACVLGIPIGIWSLVVLFQRDVQNAYGYKWMKRGVKPPKPT